jgi:chromosome segregation ATPase
VFWGSFYPTLWIGVIVVVASALFVFWGTPKTISVPSVQVQTKDIKSFVDTYEERTTIQSELASLEERLKKGKIPRRRYKVRKKMLDGRISNLSRTLSTLRGTICASGSKYSNMMNQLEVAEAKLEGAQRDKQRVRSRYNRGEISKDAYGKLLEEYQSRIESAESTINGVLFRLRD